MEPDNETQSNGLSPQEYLHILRRRRAIILQAFLIISVVGTAIALLSKNVYQANARLLVDAPTMNLNSVDASNALSQIFALTQPQNVSTQVEVLQSAPLADKVRRQIGPGNVQMAVAQVKETNLIDVVAEAGDPAVAAAAANALLNDYINDDVNQNLTEIEKAERFAENKQVKAHRRFLALQNQLQQFKHRNHLVEINANRTEQMGRVSALTDQARTMATELGALQAKLAATRSLLAAQPSTVATRVQASNALRASYQQEIDKIGIERVSLTQKGGFTAKAPQIIALDARAAALKRQLAAQPPMTTTESVSPNAIRATLQAGIGDLTTQEAAQKTQLADTRAALAQAKALVERFPVQEFQYATLKREADGAQAEDEAYSGRVADLALRAQAHHPTARIIQFAVADPEPVRPKRLQSILFACLIGLFVGVCLALLQEFLDDRINSVEEANRVLGLPSLGYVPSLSQADALLMPQMQGLDPASESYRVLRTNIHFAAVDAPARTLLVTSSNPGEGKTTTAVNLAFAMAVDGKKVILVDTDLRRPSVHKLLSLAHTPGLTDVLLGHASLDDTLLENEDMPNFVVLTAGSTPPNPSELLNSRTFRNLVDDLMGRADIVIFDSPPVLVASDAPILASQMDGTVLVVETGSTKKGAARQTVKLLHQARANVLGVAYNRMSAKDGGYGYYYYQYNYTTPGLEGGNKNGPSARLNGTGGEKGRPGDAKLLTGTPDLNGPGEGRTNEHDEE